MKNSFIAPIIIAILLIAGILFYLVYNKANGSTDYVNEYKQGIQEEQKDVPNPDNNENSQKNRDVFIEDFSFNPKEIEINIGDSVTWTNRDSVGHTATSDSGEFDSSILMDEQSFRYTFTKAGEFGYHCAPHPYMKGKIIVR